MDKVKVLLLFGGESSEHDVSISSVKNVLSAIPRDIYEPLLVYIDHQGSWHYLNSLEQHTDLTYAAKVMVQPGEKRLVLESAEAIYPDVIMPILHGRNGEDGSVQGLAQLLHLPIVGCDMTPSVLAMDKIASKQIFYANELPVLPYLVHQQDESIVDFETVTSLLGPALFIKPSRSGSSIGVSKVTTSEEYRQAIELAHAHDEFILIEKAANSPRELEVAILGSHADVRASGVGEIRPDGDFYTYDSKYSGSSSSDVIIPADLPEGIREAIRDQAVAAYRAIKCRGMARVDFLLDESGEIYLNEINTIPGFTNISMFPKLWQAEGMKYADLIDHLIKIALVSSPVDVI